MAMRGHMAADAPVGRRVDGGARGLGRASVRRPAEVPAQRRGRTAAAPAVVASASAYDSNGAGGLAARVASPTDALALPPRVALGALLALPELLADPQRAQQRLAALASGEAGAGALAEAEAALAAAADRGAAAEAELRQLLPPQLAALLPPPPPPPPPEATPAASAADRPANPLVTYSPGPPRQMPTARFAGGLAANRVGSELEQLATEVAAVRAALSAARGGGSLKALAAREARARLAAHLRQLDDAEWAAAAAEQSAPELAAALADARALDTELAALQL